jgi:hypothetical protein
MKSWLLGLSALSALSSALPFFAAAYVRVQLSTRRLKITAAFFVLCLVSELISLLVGTLTGNNMIVANTFIFLELIFWCFFFHDLLKNKIPGWVFIIIIFLMAAIWINHAVSFSLHSQNALFSILEASILIFFSAFYLLILSKSSITPIQKVPEFWFVAGALIYFTCSFIALGVSRYLLSINESLMLDSFSRSYMFFYAIINILANIIYSKAFLCISTKKI